MRLTIFFVPGLVFSLNAVSESKSPNKLYECVAYKKVDTENDYSQDMLKKYRYSTRLEVGPSGAFISRCSFSPGQKKVTCDRYQVDKIEIDPFIGVRKYYVFRNQFDFQFFQDLTSVENNGRGAIEFGKCVEVSGFK
jgi:hypothetical protein